MTSLKKGISALALTLAAGLTPLPALAENDASTLVIATHKENQAMQAQQTYKEVNSPGLRNVIEQLLTVDLDTGELAPMLATSWERIDDTTWRFTLREGVTFHDGSAFDAEAAAFAVNWVWSPDNSFHVRETMGPQITAEVAGDMMIDVMTPTPDALIPWRMYLAGISSMKQIKEDPGSVDENPVGTGPYQFVEWARGQHWEAEANPDWWGLDADDAYGDVQFERLRFLFRNEASVRAAMVKTGEADMATFVTPEACEEAANCISATSDSYLFLRPDVTGAHPAFEDVRVREAIFHAIDRKAIIEFIMGSGEHLGGQLLTSNAGGYNPDVGDWDYDPEKAKALLDEARADGVPVDDANVMVAARVGSVPRIGEIIEAVGNMLDQAGMPNRVELQEQGQIIEWFLTRPNENRANILIHPGGNPLWDYALTLRALYHCDTIVSMYCDEDFDRRLDEVALKSGEAREQALRDLVAKVHDASIVLPMARLQNAYVLNEGMDWNYRFDQRLVAVQMTSGD
ncbi:MAG: ABC transporter substrate-binding protein [Phycisphaerales bacterium]